MGATQTLPQLAIAPIVQPNPRPGPIHFKCQPLGFHCSSNNDCCSKVCETDPAIKPFARCQDAPPMFEAGGSLSFQEPMVEGGNLNLKWTDCGDSSYHAKVKALSPTILPIGQKTTITGSGNVDEQVTGSAFTITAKFGVTEHYSGDVCSSKVIKLPLGVGTITWEGLKCPVAKGDVSVAVDVSLSRLIPAKLAKGTIEIKAAGASKENLICLDIDTSAATQDLPQPTKAEAAPQQCLPRGSNCETPGQQGNCCPGTKCLADGSCDPWQELPQLAVAPVVQSNFGLAPFQEPMVEGGNLNLKWTDCGDSSYHAKVRALS